MLHFFIFFVMPFIGFCVHGQPEDLPALPAHIFSDKPQQIHSLPAHIFEGLYALEESKHGPFNVCKRTPQVKEEIMKKIRKTDPTTDCGLASFLLDQILVLKLTNKGIQSLKRGDFSGLTNLKELWLDNNQIKLLQKEVFTYMPNLRSLVLTNNLISEVQPWAFAGLRSLTHLHLNGNQINTLPQGLFTKNPKGQPLSSLQYVWIYDNPLFKNHPAQGSPVEQELKTLNPNMHIQ